ncbi:MAG: hypothetical protein WAT43_18760 [Chitinophagales bacterium]
MENFNLILDKLNFHDSTIISVNLDETGSLIVLIDYYNWEGNEDSDDKWITKKLILKVTNCLHLRFHSPGLGAFDTEIHSHECLELFDLIIKELPNYLKELNEDKKENAIAIRFLTHSYGEEIFGENFGFLEIAGLNASITWEEPDYLSSPKHISIRE